ncbi:MOB kinase activator 2-like isoform X2 [Watersipora subatra]|uniref:MOB kinase activator 2-like isoform X2 n=1 Tax=Watersipora subatra TaxID=2589382 RepID=UPI00355BE025
MDWLMGRTKRKDKDIASPSPTGPSKLYLEEHFTRETIHHHIPNLDLPTSLDELVSLPYGFPREEWFAWHTISFFEQLNSLVGIICPDCSFSTCPTMTAPGNVNYMWIDDKGKKCKCSAAQYIDYVTTYIHKTVSDHSVFPTKHGEEFPSNFISIVQKIHKYMFQVLAHIYYAHYPRMLSLQLHGHLNTFFAHFMLFNWTFKLIEEKETEIMTDLVHALKAIPEANKENHLQE